MSDTEPRERAPPRTLPIHACLEAIAGHLRERAVTIVCGSTGSGKSTQIPQLCLHLYPHARIGHTQPRRLAARTIAGRISHEMGQRLGGVVGFQTRFDQQIAADTRLKVMTDGILLQEISRDPSLRAYDVLIIDEVHERSLNIDFLLGYLRNLLPRRPELRVILMSATVEAERFQTFFGDAGIVEIPGAAHPVEIRYRPPESAEDASAAMVEALVAAVRELDAEAWGDVLVFLPGEREINEAAEGLTGAGFPDTDVLPLYARLPVAAQQRVFTPHVRRHLVLATNVAETSVTVPGVRHVIDSGLARIGSYSPRSKLQRLPISPISQASAAQRLGRCGRERPGICIRLYSEAHLARCPAYTQPELLRSNLAGVILRLADLRLGRLEEFPLLDAPGAAAINDGYLLLRELGALDADRRLLKVGKRLARLPVDPRLGRMLLAAGEADCLAEMLVIVSALSAGDIRERPVDARQAADLAHQRFRDHRSDFLWYLGAWEAVQEEWRPLSRRQQQAYCVTAFWSLRRVREWVDIHRELSARVRELSLRVNAAPASYRALHQALLAGLATRVARWERKADYTGCRQRRLRLHPASALRVKPPHWIVAAEITETSMTYARMVAKVDPKWIAHAASALVRKSHSEPQWDGTRGEVYVLEEQALYGLTLISGRRVPLHHLDPARAREVFIRHALVADGLGAPLDFHTHNLALVEKVRQAQARARRRDLLAEEDALAAFYRDRLPAEIVTRRQLVAWIREDPRREAALHMDERTVTRDGIDRIDSYLYPDNLELANMSLPLTYRYVPGEPDDGITIDIPLAAMTRINGRAFERLVPGLLAEKIAVMIRRLPKDRRRYLSPLADFAQALTAAIEGVPDALAGALSNAVTRMTGLRIDEAEWKSDNLPAHLEMRVRVLDANGAEIATTRRLADWLEAHRRDVVESFRALPWQLPEGVATDWRFGTLPDVVTHVAAGVTIHGHPALVTVEGGVRTGVFADASSAAASHREAVVQLLRHALSRDLRRLARTGPRMTELALRAVRLGIASDLAEDLLHAALERVIDAHSVPRDAAAFGVLRDAAGTSLSAVHATCQSELQELFDLAIGIVHTELPRVTGRWPDVAAEIRAEVQALFEPGFAWRRRHELQHYPRYLKALSVRIERLLENPAKDAQRRAAFDTLRARCRREADRLTADQRSRLRFLLSEFQVALFAPTLRTAEKVSPQRIEDFLATLDFPRGAAGP
ncbi:MAG: ATP-dependent RNA helicase HrpA [Gammaproteobacteria bacterium]